MLSIVIFTLTHTYTYQLKKGAAILSCSAVTHPLGFLEGVLEYSALDQLVKRIKAGTTCLVWRLVQYRFALSYLLVSSFIFHISALELGLIVNSKHIALESRT